MTRPALKQLLKDALNGNELILDAESRALLSHDIASGEAVAEIVVRPTSIASLSNAVALAAKTNFALIPRGSGHSYSGGTVPDRTQSMVVDTTALNKIIEINKKDRFVRVQSGCTWATLLEALEPLGYRIPFFGPFVLKVITIPVFYILNAVGWIVSGVAIKKGYVNELSKSRTVTLALLIGIIIGYILGNLIPLE